MNYTQSRASSPSISNSKVVILVGTFISIFMAIGLINTLSESRSINERIERSKAQLELEQAKNEELTDQYEYMQTDLYIETVARNNLNLVRENELSISLPPEVSEYQDTTQMTHQTTYEYANQPNFVKWFLYIF
jgi:cell division protein FtsB